MSKGFDRRKHLKQRLKNYKSMHEKTAKDKGCYEEFMAAPTLTQARGILWGFKSRRKKKK